MALGKSGLRKRWTEAKDAAKVLWDRSKPQGEYLDEVMGTSGAATRPFPLSFKSALGPALDAVDKAYSKGDAEAREKACDVAEKRIGEYRTAIQKARATLDEADPKIAVLLLKALDDLDVGVAEAVKHDKTAVKNAFDTFKTAHKAWKDAKAKSEKAHARAVKHKQVGPMLKAAKLTKYPFTFADGLGPLLEKIRDKAVKLDPSVRADMDTMLDKVKSYKAEVRKGREKYDSALATVDASALIDPIVDPLMEGLKAVKGTLDHLTQK